MNRIKELRKEKKLTQKALAEKLKIPYRTIQNWENEDVQIKPDKAKQLADYFNVTIAYLLGYSDFEKSGSLKDLLFHEIKGLKEYRMLRVGNENYISENDVLNVISRYVNS
ncbi:transcriptional regulator [Streptococcus pseudoporcinus]|uniref:Transcriptional regulator n=1 Tax=Streptococcus pseudoporcinus TaxID=361101 RepID=A0A4U9XLW9_9STRE|nr:transcriptional regulator [Streptococcus pseudoporcinus]